jgi:hypothetical protein
MNNDAYGLFSHFWWLIFPLFWMIFMLAMGWSRHARANRALDILKTYADQGKDPPPELLKGLQNVDSGCSPYSWRYAPARLLQRGFLFLALAAAFGFMSLRNFDDGDHWHHHGGLLIPALIFAALAFSNFLSLLFTTRGWPPNDRDGR